MAAHSNRHVLLIANAINIGADLGAMADASGLLGGPQVLYVLLFAAICIALQMFLQYTSYVSVLKWLTLSLFAYVACLFMVKVPWGEALGSLVIPSVHWDKDYLTTVVAVLGTTISPYLFFWQASQEAEDVRTVPARQILKRAPQQGEGAVNRIHLDTFVGMAERTSTCLPTGPQDGTAGGRSSALGPDPALLREASGFRSIHARAETVAENEWFSDAYRRRRCIVPMNSFFQKNAVGKRYAISRRDGGPFGVAGIWENWRAPWTGAWERTFAVITVPANELVVRIHDRMPAILPNEQFSRWLSDEADPRRPIGAVPGRPARGFAASLVCKRGDLVTAT